jgi:hypothetical protein
MLCLAGTWARVPDAGPARTVAFPGQHGHVPTDDVAVVRNAFLPRRQASMT